MKRVLVTGGKGFLGSHMVRRLLKEDVSVRIFTRPSSSAAEVLPENWEERVELVPGDIRDEKSVCNAVAGMDEVIHLVSNFRSAGSDKDDAYSVNVDGTRNILQACEQNSVQRLVHCSTIGVHGAVKEIPANEETDFNPKDLYQETKLAAEQMVWEFHQQTQLPVSVVRPISIYGPGDRRLLKLFKMIKRGYFVMVGDGSAYFQPAYIDDVVEGFMLALTKEEAVGEAFIVGGEQYLPLKSLVKKIARLLQVPAPKLRIPLAPVLALAQLSEKIFVPLGLEPPLHRRRVSFFMNDRAFSIQKAKEVLGFEPKVSLQDGLQRTIRWYEQHGWL